MTMKSLFKILALLLAVVVGQNVVAQRRVTPVNTPATATQPVNENRQPRDSMDRAGMQKFRDDKGNVVYLDTITGREIVDSSSMAKVPPMIYPLVFDATVGVDVGTPLMRALGQSHGVSGVQFMVNLHNRYIPVFEVGMGEAHSTPAYNNFTYKSKLSPYFKLGLNYNFLYNSNPQYQAFAGVRYGISPFKWTLTDATVDNTYWGDETPMAFPEVKATAGYFEMLFGLKVMVYKNLSMGWSVNYRAVMHQSPVTHGKAWYIPGYGTTGSPLGAAVTLYYTIPLNRQRSEKNLTDNEK